MGDNCGKRRREQAVTTTGAYKMEAEPTNYPEHTDIYQWGRGIDIEGLPEREELEAIIEAAGKVKEKPRYFRVNGKLYTLSREVWQKIKRGNI